MSEIDGIIANAIPNFGAPVLQGLEFEESPTPGVLQMKQGASRRQYVRFYEKQFFSAALAQNSAKVNGRTKPNEEDISKGYEKKLCVQIVTPGDKTEFDSLAEDYHKRAYFRQYKAFREGRTAPEGLSVDDCEFILPPEATELRHMGIHTVEQLADAGDIAMQELPRGFELRDYAQAWCKANHGDALVETSKKMAAELNDAKDVIQKQTQMLEAMQKELAEQRDLMRQIQDAQMEAEIATETRSRKK